MEKENPQGLYLKVRSMMEKDKSKGKKKKKKNKDPNSRGPLPEIVLPEPVM